MANKLDYLNFDNIPKSKDKSSGMLNKYCLVLHQKNRLSIHLLRFPSMSGMKNDK
jgi:hypothetical protein